MVPEWGAPVHRANLTEHLPVLHRQGVAGMEHRGRVHGRRTGGGGDRWWVVADACGEAGAGGPAPAPGPDDGSVHAPSSAAAGTTDTIHGVRTRRLPPGRRNGPRANTAGAGTERPTSGRTAARRAGGSGGG
ncbi:hypothetical protein GCM10010294_56210 [Streptomyces griseoloalbus]|nr:hypothetical protein GCM10010294_56210 [Streptomyces griseoloalbus]